jgi:hypothetical protein
VRSRVYDSLGKLLYYEGEIIPIFFDNLPSIASRSKTKYLHNYSRLYLGKTYNVENIYYDFI